MKPVPATRPFGHRPWPFRHAPGRLAGGGDTLAVALEKQGRLDETDAVLIEAQTQSNQPEEITLSLAPAMLAAPAMLGARRAQWPVAAQRWIEALRRFPGRPEIEAGLREALARIDIDDPLATETARAAAREAGPMPG